MTFVKTLVIPAAEGEPFVAELSEGFGWREIGDIIGGYFTAIEGDGWHAYLDEEGQTKQLPVNIKATALLRHHGWRGTYVFGPVVIFGRGVDGEEADVPEELVRSVVAPST